MVTMGVSTVFTSSFINKRGKDLAIWKLKAIFLDKSRPVPEFIVLRDWLSPGGWKRQMFWCWAWLGSFEGSAAMERQWLQINMKAWKSTRLKWEHCGRGPPCHRWCTSSGLRRSGRQKPQSWRWRRTRPNITFSCFRVAERRPQRGTEFPAFSRCCRIPPNFQRGAIQMWNSAFQIISTVRRALLPSSSNRWKTWRLWGRRPWNIQSLRTCPLAPRLWERGNSLKAVQSQHRSAFTCNSIWEKCHFHVSAYLRGLNVTPSNLVALRVPKKKKKYY